MATHYGPMAKKSASSGSTPRNNRKRVAMHIRMNGVAARQPKFDSLNLSRHGGVNCTPYGEDKYGRALATCSAGTIRDLGEVLVREGYAVGYTAGNRGYTDAEREARSARRGIWQGDFELPRSWRQRHPYEDRKS